MECAVEEEKCSFIQNSEANDPASSENFQKFITELFEKNGILNDLRAYLRGHIIDVLKSAETGALPACQKHFTQRLELMYQALNILMAEYLLRLEFNYSLSVYLSEIPLSNMVFDFAQSLLKTPDTDMTGLRFNENDVWSILYYLGIKCDSEHASKIIELYQQGELPLIYCILKCIPMYHKESISLEDGLSSDERLPSSAQSADSCDEKPTKHNHRSAHKCKHYVYCKTCQKRVSRLKERCRNRKIRLEKTDKLTSGNASNIQSFMTSVNLMEKSLIDEISPNHDYFTVKNYYYPINLSDDENASNSCILKNKKIATKRCNANNIDIFFETPKKKKKSITSSCVAQASDGGVSFISSNNDDGANASYLMKIEIYDMKNLKEISPVDYWKHADLRLKYYIKSNTDKHYQNTRDIIYNITKQIASTEDCKKYFIDRQRDNKKQ